MTNTPEKIHILSARGKAYEYFDEQAQNDDSQKKEKLGKISVRKDIMASSSFLLAMTPSPDPNWDKRLPLVSDLPSTGIVPTTSLPNLKNIRKQLNEPNVMPKRKKGMCDELPPSLPIGENLVTKKDEVVQYKKKSKQSNAPDVEVIAVIEAQKSDSCEVRPTHVREDGYHFVIDSNDKTSHVPLSGDTDSAKDVGNVTQKKVLPTNSIKSGGLVLVPASATNTETNPVSPVSAKTIPLSRITTANMNTALLKALVGSQEGRKLIFRPHMKNHKTLKVNNGVIMHSENNNYFLVLKAQDKVGDNEGLRQPIQCPPGTVTVDSSVSHTASLVTSKKPNTSNDKAKQLSFTTLPANNSRNEDGHNEPRLKPAPSSSLSRNLFMSPLEPNSLPTVSDIDVNTSGFKSKVDNSLPGMRTLVIPLLKPPLNQSPNIVRVEDVAKSNSLVIPKVTRKIPNSPNFQAANTTLPNSNQTPSPMNTITNSGESTNSRVPHYPSLRLRPSKSKIDSRGSRKSLKSDRSFSTSGPIRNTNTVSQSEPATASFKIFSKSKQTADESMRKFEKTLFTPVTTSEDASQSERSRKISVEIVDSCIDDNSSKKNLLFRTLTGGHSAVKMLKRMKNSRDANKLPPHHDLKLILKLTEQYISNVEDILKKTGANYSIIVKSGTDVEILRFSHEAANKAMHAHRENMVTEDCDVVFDSRKPSNFKKARLVTSQKSELLQNTPTREFESTPSPPLEISEDRASSPDVVNVDSDPSGNEHINFRIIDHSASSHGVLRDSNSPIPACGASTSPEILASDFVCVESNPPDPQPSMDVSPEEPIVEIKRFETPLSVDNITPSVNSRNEDDLSSGVSRKTCVAPAYISIFKKSAMRKLSAPANNDATDKLIDTQETSVPSNPSPVHQEEASGSVFRLDFNDLRKQLAMATVVKLVDVAYHRRYRDVVFNNIHQHGANLNTFVKCKICGLSLPLRRLLHHLTLHDS